MMWQEYVMNDHCPEYENLTIEEKLLVDAGMRKWFASKSLQELCVPMFIFRLAESRIIEELKEKDGRRKTRNANAKAGVIGRKRNESSRQRKAR